MKINLIDPNEPGSMNHPFKMEVTAEQSIIVHGMVKQKLWLTNNPYLYHHGDGQFRFGTCPVMFESSELTLITYTDYERQVHPMSEGNWAMIADHSQFVMKGVKPCSVLCVKATNIEQARQTVEKQGALCMIKPTEDSKWIHLWIFKHEEVRQLIEGLPHMPRNNYDHFVLGLAFGYGINEIVEFIREQPKEENQ